MRIDRFLSLCGIGTRKEVKDILKQGRVKLDCAVIRDPGTGIDPAKAHVFLDDQEIIFEQYEYYMLNKPAGIVSASRVKTLKRGEKVPEGQEQFVVDLIRASACTDLFPAGRLDKDTEGLLVITNDGKLSFRLLSPRFHVDKKYYVELDSVLAEEDEAKVKSGISIGDDTPTLPCRIEKLTDKSLYITIREGRYHQIKRMFQAVGNEVTYLKRVAFGPLVLDEELKPGQYRKLTEQELRSLKEAAGL